MAPDPSPTGTPPEPTRATAWLIERAYPNAPPHWWCDEAEYWGWTEDATLAIRFASRADAEEKIVELSGIAGVHDPFGRATEHVFVDLVAPLAPSSAAPTDGAGQSLARSMADAAMASPQYQREKAAEFAAPPPSTVGSSYAPSAATLAESTRELARYRAPTPASDAPAPPRPLWQIVCAKHGMECASTGPFRSTLEARENLPTCGFIGHGGLRIEPLGSSPTPEATPPRLLVTDRFAENRPLAEIHAAAPAREASSAPAPTGSCLICGRLRPFGVWVDQSLTAGRSIGACVRCRDARHVVAGGATLTTPRTGAELLAATDRVMQHYLGDNAPAYGDARFAIDCALQFEDRAKAAEATVAALTAERTRLQAQLNSQQDQGETANGQRLAPPTRGKDQ